jgi:hypothetical protein
LIRYFQSEPAFYSLLISSSILFVPLLRLFFSKTKLFWFHVVFSFL